MKMLKVGNSTSHVYDEKLAERIYKNIKQYYPIMLNAYLYVQNRFDKEE